MKKIIRAGVLVIAALLTAALIGGAAAKMLGYADSGETAAGLSVKAKSALLIDYHTGTVVYEYNPAAHMPIASMVKIMTLNIIFDEIEKGSLSLDADITASANAGAMGGSQAFLDANATYKAGELIKTVIVASANDSCVALAEHISGSVEEFVARMNEKAAALGMRDTHFANCTGLPAPGAYSCARDVAAMTRELLKHEGFYQYSTVWMFDFVHPGGRVTELSNTNKLLKAYEGCDGGKTGFTSEAMYCLSATAKRGGTRLVSVVMGAATSKERNAENAKLFNYGFANYETRQLVAKGESLADPARVQKGKEDFVNVCPAADLYYFGKKGKRDVAFEPAVSPLTAPVAMGQAAGELIVKLDGAEIGRVPLTAEKDVGKKTYLDIVGDVIGAW